MLQFKKAYLKQMKRRKNYLRSAEQLYEKTKHRKIEGLLHGKTEDNSMSNIRSESKDEYLMLREEILHLDNIANNTINFFYAFIATYIAFALTQEDTIFLLLTFIGIIPPYLIVLNKMNALCKVGAYLYVFHEGENFKWERRNMSFKLKYENSSFRIISWHFPFVFGSLAVSVLLLYRINWSLVSVVDIIKILVCIVLLFWVMIKAYKNRNISPKNYIEKWEEFTETNVE